MLFKKKKRFRTQLPNGQKPSYKDLEQSFLVTWEKLQKANAEVKRLNLANAGLRHEMKVKEPKPKTRDEYQKEKGWDKWGSMQEQAYGDYLFYEFGQ